MLSFVIHEGYEDTDIHQLLKDYKINLKRNIAQKYKNIVILS